MDQETKAPVSAIYCKWCSMRLDNGQAVTRSGESNDLGIIHRACHTEERLQAVQLEVKSLRNQIADLNYHRAA